MSPDPHDPGSIEAARAAKEKVRALLTDLIPLEGIGITRVGDRYAVKINLRHDTEHASRLPDAIDGVPVVVHITGRARKQEPNDDA